jgi:tetratricopeptide (TPR) repeat protein
MPGWADIEELRFEEAVRAYRRCHRMEPDNPLGRFLYGWALALARRVEEGLAVLDHLAADGRDSVMGALALCMASALRGNEPAVTTVAASLTAAARWNDFNSARLAECYALVGHTDEAIEWLRNASNRGISYHLLLSHDWFLLSLHADSRFKELIERMKDQCERFEV